MSAFAVHRWQRDPRNPILVPGGGGGDFDVGCCMNPFVLRRGEEYWLYYAGADREGDGLERDVEVAGTGLREIAGDEAIGAEGAAGAALDVLEVAADHHLRH